MADGGSGNLQKGKKGEDLAAERLLNSGYEIRERNYRSGKGEIDLIAFKNSTLVFVEVKLRSDFKFGYPEKAVTPSKAKKLKETALAYMQQINWHGLIRFDIVSVSIKGKEVEIMTFEDAF